MSVAVVALRQVVLKTVHLELTNLNTPLRIRSGVFVWYARLHESTCDLPAKF